MNATEELQYIDSYEKVDQVLERVAAIRESCGKYFGIAVDFHGRVHKPSQGAGEEAGGVRSHVPGGAGALRAYGAV